MIARFLDSWTLFGDAYLAGWLLAVLLGLLGVPFVARNQVFVGAAAAQASVLGVALTLAGGALLSPDHAHAGIGEVWSHVLAPLFSVAAVLVASRSAQERRESTEAITAWVFLGSAALSVLVVSHSPVGLDEIQRLASSSLIGASRREVILYAVLAAGAGALFLRHRTGLVLLIMDPPMAEACGIRVARWNLALGVAAGLAIGLSLGSAGMLYTFGLLVLPGLAARSLAREVRTLFALAPAIALAGAVAGFVLAHEYDFPPAQMTVALLAALQLPAWAIRRTRAR